MIRHLTILGMAFCLSVGVACQPAGDRGAEDVVEDTGTVRAGGLAGTQPPPLELVPCRANANQPEDQREVTSDGTENRPLRLASLGHQLHIRPGVVPANSTYTYTLKPVQAGDSGCQVIATKDTDSPINQQDETYVIEIRCIGMNGHGSDDKCNSNMKIVRAAATLEEVGGSVDPLNDRSITAVLDSLSTYALAAPGGGIGEEP